MRSMDVIRFSVLGVVLCAAAIVPALTMGGSAKADPLRLGDSAPALAVSEWVQGAPLKLCAPDGQIVVVTFWATYCPPCRDALPLLSELQKRYAGDGVRVVCIGHESREKTVTYLGEFSPPLRQSFALDSHWITTRQYLDGLAVLGIPYAIIVGGDGRIAWHGNPLTDPLEAPLREMIGISDSGYDNQSDSGYDNQ